MKRSEICSLREMEAAPARLDPGEWPTSQFPWRTAKRMGVGAAVFAVTVIVIGWFSFHRDDEQPEAHLSEQNVAALEPIVGGHEGHPEKFLPAEEPVTISAALETVPPQIIEPGSRTIPRPTPRPQR